MATERSAVQTYRAFHCHAVSAEIHAKHGTRVLAADFITGTGGSTNERPGIGAARGMFESSVVRESEPAKGTSSRRHRVGSIQPVRGAWASEKLLEAPREEHGVQPGSLVEAGGAKPGNARAPQASQCTDRRSRDVFAFMEDRQASLACCYKHERQETSDKDARKSELPAR